MTTTTVSGTTRTHSNPNGGYARDYSVRRPTAPAPNRSAEDPFDAANGTLYFSNRRTASSAGRSSSAARPASSTRAGTTRSSATQRRTTGSSSRSPKKRKRRRIKNKRLFLFALGFLMFAVIVLAVAIAAASCSCAKKPSNSVSPDNPASSAAPFTTASAAVSDDTLIETNAFVEGVSVQNLTVGEARTRILRKLEEKKQSVSLTVSYENYDPLTLTAADIGLSYDEADVNAVLFSVASGSSARDIPLSIDGEKLRAALYELNDKIPNHAVDAHAEVSFKYNKIDGVSYPQPVWEFTDGVNGAKIDFNELEQQIKDAIDAGNFTASLTPSVTVSEPEITTAVLKQQLSLLGSYSTNYRFKGSSSTDPEVAETAIARDHNISKAASLMQVVTLEPGERFSYNNRTGERTEKRDWWPAPAVYLGDHRKEPGGGVCQVSTTIFNAILRAGIRDITRRGHSIPSDYVTAEFKNGLGLDATVDYGHIDFGFKNDTGHTIYMFVYITKNKSSNRRKNINVEIYGWKEDGVEYRCSNEIIEEWPYKDPSKYEYENDRHMLETDEPILLNTPRDGYKVVTYVDKYKDGRFVERWRTEETVYNPIYPKYRRGTAKVTPEPTNTPKPTPSTAPDPEEP